MNNRHSAALADRKTSRGASSKLIHTTLPMDDLIGMFESEIRGIVPFHSFEYEDPRSATHIFRGVQKLHKCHYRLNVSGLDLGRISLTRATPFTEAESDRIEAALGALMIHLNNALDYQAGLGEQALTALRVDAAYSALD